MDPDARLRRIEAQNDEILRRLAALEGNLRWQPVHDAAPASAEGPSVDVPVRPDGGSRRAQAAPEAGDDRWGAAPFSPPWPSAPAVHRPQPGRMSWDDLESRIGVKWVGWAGGAILLLGTVFFLKLAFDRGWIGPLARIVLGVVAGLAIWGTGEAVRSRVHAVYGQVLAATGASMAFATVWIAFGLDRYQAVTDLPDLGGTLMLSLLAAGVMLHAALARAPVLACTSLAMVFLHPVAAAPVAGYGAFAVAVLAVGAIAADLWRRWGWLAVAAQGMHIALWIQLASDPTGWPTLVTGTILVGAGVATSMSQRLPLWSRLSGAGLAWGLGTFTISAAAVRLWPAGDAAAWVLLAVGVAAGLLALSRPARPAHAAASVVAFYAWPALHFTWTWTVAVWGLETALVAAVAWRTRSAPLAILAVAASLGLAGWSIAQGVRGAPPDAAHITAFGTAAVASILAWLVLRPWRTLPEARWPALVAAVLVPMAAAAAFRDDPLVTLAWALVAGAALGAGALLQWMDLRLAGLSVIGTVLLRVVFVDLADADPLVRAVAFLAVGVVLLGVGFLYARALRRGRGRSGSAATTP